MADMQQLERALINADAAGDVQAAQTLAAEIKRMRGAAEPAKPAERQSNMLVDGAAGVLKGASRIGTTLLKPIDAGARALGIQNDFIGRTDRSESIDQFMRDRANPDSLAFKTGDIGTQIAGTAGVGGVLGNLVSKAAPAATGLANALTTGGFRAGVPATKALSLPGLANGATRAAGGAATGAASAGMVDPDFALSGAVVGGALPLTLGAVGKAGSGLAKAVTLNGPNKQLAQTAVNDFNIPLGVADVTDSKSIKALRSVLNDAPFSGGVGAAQREKVQQGFNRAVGGTFGAAETKLTPSVIDSAKKRMGDEFDRIWNNNVLHVDGELFTRMTELQKQAAKLPKNEGASLTAEINDLFSKVQQGADGVPVIPGDVANKFQSYLRRRAEGSAGLRNELGDLRQNIISAFNRSVNPEDAAALTMNRQQYKAFKTVEPLLNAAEVGVAGRLPGDIPASLLPQAVAKSYKGGGASDLGQLAQIGSRFIVDRTPQTGGSMRAAMQNTALGAAVVGGGLSNPLLAAAAIPIAAGTNGLLGSPMVSRMALKGGGAPSQGLLSNDYFAQLPYRSLPLLANDR